ncbi:MAG TPA: PilZ domain-containing protein [Novosphingobium sp.]|nr:PilZ domain-containing protein [Novosphingobium sp.]
MATTGFIPTPIFREKRRSRLIKLEMRDSADVLRDILVRDVSAHGFSAVARREPPVLDEVVSVTMPDARVLWGIVRWVEGKSFGVEFDVS